MKQFSLTILIACSLTVVYAQHKISDHLGTAAISFQKKMYHLSWSSHPTASYYKQEYLPKGDSVNDFKTMLLLEVATGTSNLKDVVAAKIAELDAIKQRNPMAQYESFSNTKTGEFMLDFLITANTPDGGISIIERNVYRYKTFTDKKGTTGIVLFGVSERSYGSETHAFLQKLKKEKNVLVNAVATMAWPGVKL